MADSLPPAAPYELHAHTHYSYDATASVEGLFRYASARGVRFLAITEHHVIDSFSEIGATARCYPEVTWIPAAELTVTASIGAVDLVCLGLPSQPTGELRNVLEEYHHWQRRCGAAVREGMAAIGFDYTEAHWHELLRSYRPPAALAVQGWTHVRNDLQ
ncbi:MAG: PHP domain-containing protein, partial [Armatimonadota bacterium]|nr:PHP domain-containing protein [Armatimonadota bacterium]